VFTGWEETTTSKNNVTAQACYCYPSEKQSTSSMLSNTLQCLASVQNKQSWYDGLITKKLKGIIHKGQEILTRLHTWQVEYLSQPAMLAAN
jgi:uncharacterized protein YcfL